MPAARAALVLALALLAPACGASRQQGAGQPLLPAAAPGLDICRNEAVAPPLVSRLHCPGRPTLVVAPLLSWSRQPDTSGTQDTIRFLYPLGRWQDGPAGQELTFIPAVDAAWPATADQAAAASTFFPLFWGRTAGGERYGGLFPVAGELKDRFNAGRIRFALWPLWSEVRTGDNAKTHLLWPVVSYAQGPDQSGCKLWPLGGRFEKTGRSRSWFALWPLLSGSQELEGERVRGERLAVFPFYGTAWSGSRQETWWLWPFFSWTEDPGQGWTSRDLLWPLVRISDGPDRRLRRYWPLWSESDAPGRRESFLLWPFFSRSQEELTGGVRMTTASGLLIARHRQHLAAGSGQVLATDDLLWPLFRDTSAQGWRRLRVLDPFSILGDGFDLHYGGLFRVVDLVTGPDELVQLDLLFGLAGYEREPARARWRLAYLFDLRRGADWDSWSLALLGGLWQHWQGPDQGGGQLLHLFRYGDSRTSPGP
ncbi:MAG: hypothetical protein AB1634_01385 [Thermodesulfobacteriota bacterium]